MAADFAAKRQALEKSFAPGLMTGVSNEAARIEQLAALDQEESGENLRHSFAGYLGRAIEPVIAPLGFDWKIGIGIIASFAAREVFVSTMSTVYNVADDKTDTSRANLAQTLQEQKRPEIGRAHV